jgi:cytochrome c
MIRQRYQVDGLAGRLVEIERCDMTSRRLTLFPIRAAVKSVPFAMAAVVLGFSSALAGDAVAGKQVFATTCGVCHSTEPGVKIGPSLAGIFGSKSGAVPGYDFSPALKAASITWDEAELDKFLRNPTADVHGTKMTISVPSAENRQNIIAYLETLK